MTREEARKIVEMFEFIKAYAEGKEIEVKQFDETWYVVKSPDFNSEVERYRVYAPNYRPFKNGYECKNTVLKHGMEIINKVTNIKVAITGIGENGIEVNGNYRSYEDAFKYFKFPDNHSFGIEVNMKTNIATHDDKH